MKRVFAIVLTVVLVLSLAACGKKAPAGKYGTKDAYISFSNGSAVVVANGSPRAVSYSVHGSQVYITDGFQTFDFVYDAARDTLTDSTKEVYPHFR